MEEQIKEEILFDCKDLKKTYVTGDISLKALDGVDIKIKKGLIYTILGPSGSGKTTLLNMISGIDDLTSGVINFYPGLSGEKSFDIGKLKDKELTTYRREHTGFVFQSYNLIGSLTVRENVELGANLSKNALDIDAILEQVGMSDQKHKFPHQLSGGQQQRVAIARVVVKNPDIIFCDEPTGALDEKNGREVLGLLQKLNKENGTTICMVTHNPNIGFMSHKVIKFNSGKIIKFIDNETLLSSDEIEWA